MLVDLKETDTFCAKGGKCKQERVLVLVFAGHWAVFEFGHFGCVRDEVEDLKSFGLVMKRVEMMFHLVNEVVDYVFDCV